jgi:aquaporin Z
LAATRSNKLAAELIGTFFATLVPTSVDVLFFTGSGVDFVSRWLARGFITAALIYALAETSGAHINPAVSLGFVVRGVMPWQQMLRYWLAQFAGAFAAAGLAYALWGDRVALGASRPGPDYNLIVAVLAELVATFLLLMVILLTADQEHSVGKQAAIAVGLTVATCGFFVGGISGASMNPARSIAPQIIGGIPYLCWVYIVGPCAGAALAAAAAWLLCGPPQHGEKKAARGS